MEVLVLSIPLKEYASPSTLSFARDRKFKVIIATTNQGVTPDKNEKEGTVAKTSL